MAEKILHLRKFGASMDLNNVTAEDVEAFLPSLVLHAIDNPSDASSILSLLSSNPRTAELVTYASLDFDCIKGMALSEKKVERTTEEILSNDNTRRKDWECLEFQTADKANRAKIMITSISRSAKKFDRLLNSVMDEHNGQLKIREAQGGIWNNEAFILDLLVLLPLIVSRCPDLLGPDILLKGLLATKWGAPLLAATLMNNPLIQETCIMFLAQFLAMHMKTSEKDSVYPNLYFFSNSAASDAFSGENSRCKFNPFVSHCLQQACWTFVLLCQYIPGLAAASREILVAYCTFIDMIMLLTVEILHDEIDFFSRLMFSNHKTSKWFISSISTGYKNPMPLPSVNKTIRLPKVIDIFGQGLIAFSARNTKHVIQSVQNTLISEAKKTYHKGGWTGCLCSHLKLYCVLIGGVGLDPTYEEVNFWINALQGETTASSVASGCASQILHAEYRLRLGIAFLSVVPGLLSLVGKDTYDACIASLLGPFLLERESVISEFELGVWVSVQLLLQNYGNVSEFVRKTVGMESMDVVNMSSVKSLCEAVKTASKILDPCFMAKAAVMLRPSGAICSNGRHGQMLLEVLNQLMSSRQFVKCGIDIGEAVMSCISCSTTPIHPMLIQLIQNFAELTSWGSHGHSTSQEFKMQPLPFNFVSASLKAVTSQFTVPKGHSNENHVGCGDHLHESKHVAYVKPSVMTIAALVTWYILCREQVLRSSGVSVGYFSCGSFRTHHDGILGVQWSEILASMPLHGLLIYMSRRWTAYEHLFPQWLSLAYRLFPEKLLVTDLLKYLEGAGAEDLCSTLDFSDVNALNKVREQPVRQTDFHQENNTNQFHGKQGFIIEKICRAFRSALLQPLAALEALETIRFKEAKNKFEAQCALVMELVPILLDASCARMLQNCFCDWWKRLPHEEIVQLAPYFVNSIKITSANISGNKHCASQKLKESFFGLKLLQHVTCYDELVHEPLAILACKNEIYRTPLLPLLLDLLWELLAENRKIYLTRVPKFLNNEEFKQENVFEMLALQDSSACQILLEACIEFPCSKDDADHAILFESRKSIFAFISSLLHSNPLLLKLLHFQGYDTQLIPVMMDNISSMVQCFGFVHELVQRVKATHIAFCVALIANLIKKYPNHPQGLLIAQQAIERVKTIKANGDDLASSIIGTLEPLAWCAVTFPSLVHEITMFLQSCLHNADVSEKSNRNDAEHLHEVVVNALKIINQEKVPFRRLIGNKT